MIKFSFTDAKLKKLKPQKKRYAVYDEKIAGLELLVYPKGTKTFNIYKRVNNKVTRHKIGALGEYSVIDARIVVERNNLKINEDKHYMANEKILQNKLNDVFVKYMDTKLELEKTTKEEYFRLWQKHIEKNIGNKKVVDITVHDIEKLKKEMSNTTYQFNRVRTLMNSTYSYLIENCRCNITSPTKAVKKFKEKAIFVNNPQEKVKKIIKAINDLMKEKPTLSLYCILCLVFIPVRKNTLYKMKWKNIDFDKKLWTIPKTKNQENLSLTLPNAIIPILEQIREAQAQENIKSEYVFFSSKSKSGHLEDVKNMFIKIKEKAGLNERFRLHDFRHAFGTQIAIDTGNPYIVKASLGHNSIKSSEPYVNIARENIANQVNKVANDYVPQRTGDVDEMVYIKDNKIKKSILSLLQEGSTANNEILLKHNYNEKKKNISSAISNFHSTLCLSPQEIEKELLRHGLTKPFKLLG